jgi:hypothetical protein
MEIINPGMYGRVLTIDKGIPVPNRYDGARVFPCGNLEVGDSFFIPDILGEDEDGELFFSPPSGLYAMKRKYEKRHGHRYTLRRMDGGLRLWRMR